MPLRSCWLLSILMLDGDAAREPLNRPTESKGPRKSSPEDVSGNSCEDRFVRRLEHRGRDWPSRTYLDQAHDQVGGCAGRLIAVGAGPAIAIAEVVDVAVNGLVYVRPLTGPVTEQRLARASQRV